MPTLPDGRHDIANVNLTGSTFRGVRLAEATFDDVNLAAATFHDVNLAGARFDDVNLSGVTITANANLKGMTIDGVNVHDALHAYRRQSGGGDCT
jgi:uncharacterized protein YjbI with pentapeptide repeats